MNFLRFLSTLTLRGQLANKLNTAFSGSRDYNQVLGYPDTVTYEQMYERFKRMGLTRCIVALPAESTWARVPQIVSSNSRLDKTFQLLAKERDFIHYLCRTDILSGIGRFGVLLLGFDNTVDLKTPVTPKGHRRLLFLAPYSEGSVRVKEYEDNVHHERFGLPRVYTIQATVPTEGIGASGRAHIRTVDVHFTRIIHVAEGTLESDIYGTPRLEPVWNYLDDLLKVVGCSAEAFWLTSNKGIQVNVDPEMNFTTKDADALNDEIEEYMHQLRRFIRTRGVELKPLGTEVADPKNHFTSILQLVAATAGIPLRFLIGSEVGQLASAQDRQNWADSVISRRELFATPRMLRPFIEALTYAGVLPSASSDNYEFKWEAPIGQSDFDKARTSYSLASAVSSVSKACGKSPLTINEIRTTLFSMPELTDAEIEELPSLGDSTEDPNATDNPPDLGDGSTDGSSPVAGGDSIISD